MRRLIGLVVLFCGCGDGFAIGSQESAVRCSGQYNQQVTADYMGAREEVLGGAPETIGHASATELAYSTLSGQERFAVAWIKRSDRKVYVRRWNVSQKQFMDANPVLLSPWASPGWVRQMGYDDNCVALQAYGETQCAWFTWEDDSGDADYAAIGANGTVMYPKWVDGHAPSGDTGIKCNPGCTRKKLLVWVSGVPDPDRTQIRYSILDNAGNIGPINVLWNVPSPYKGYQTEVSYSTAESRWQVIWAENDPNGCKNGRVLSRYVNFDGTLGPAPSPWPPSMQDILTFCEGDWNAEACRQCTSAADSIASVSPRMNNNCYCKGLWFSWSYYGTLYDRYRLIQYDKHVRMSNVGARSAIEWGSGNVKCGTYCPVTEAGFVYWSGSGWDWIGYQFLSDGGHYRLKRDSFTKYNDGIVFDVDPSFATVIPQAFRSNGNVAAALATDQVRDQPAVAKLRLSIVDVKQNGCPP